MPKTITITADTEEESDSHVFAPSEDALELTLALRNAEVPAGGRTEEAITGFWDIVCGKPAQELQPFVRAALIKLNKSITKESPGHIEYTDAR